MIMMTKLRIFPIVRLCFKHALIKYKIRFDSQNQLDADVDPLNYSPAGPASKNQNPSVHISVADPDLQFKKTADQNRKIKSLI